MSKKLDVNSDREIIKRFDTLFEDIPELQTEEEINEFLQTIGYSAEELKRKGQEFAEKLLESNWRFVSEEIIENQREKLLTIDLQINNSRESIIKKIKETTQALSARGITAPLLPGVAHRNLEKETKQDLASLLRQIEHIAKEAGIDLGEK